MTEDKDFELENNDLGNSNFVDLPQIELNESDKKNIENAQEVPVVEASNKVEESNEQLNEVQVQNDGVQVKTENPAQVNNQTQVNNAIPSQEINGKTIELASDVEKQTELSSSKFDSTLPVDVKPFLNMIKEKTILIGKKALELLNNLGEMVLSIFPKKQ